MLRDYFFPRFSFVLSWENMPGLIDFLSSSAYNDSGEEREKSPIWQPKRERVTGCKRAWLLREVPPGAARQKDEYARRIRSVTAIFQGAPFLF